MDEARASVVDMVEALASAVGYSGGALGCGGSTGKPGGLQRLCNAP